MTYQFSKVENKGKKNPSYLKEDEFLKLIKLVKQPHHKLAFILAFNSGLRISEVVKLQPEDVDISGKRILLEIVSGERIELFLFQKVFQKYI